MNVKKLGSHREFRSNAMGRPRAKMHLLALRFVSLLCLASMFFNTVNAQNSQPHSPGFVKELSGSQEDIFQALNEVIEDQTIHGTQVPALAGAIVVETSPLFEPWKQEGKVFYKIRREAIAPPHFAGSADRGTIAVRYVVTNVNLCNARLRIDAVYFNTAHGTRHASDGTVEVSEYKAFEDHLHAIHLAKLHAGAPQHRQQLEDEQTRLIAAELSIRDLEQQANTLRREVEKKVKAPGADLRAGPYKTALAVQTLPASTIVAILVVTPHWYVVQTPGGQRGWIPQDQLENLP
jgi:hypothetical protein